MSMKLEEYLRQNNETISSLAHRLRKRDWNVRRYLKGCRPGPAMIVDIYKATKGLVTPNDWYDLPDLTKEQ